MSVVEALRRVDAKKRRIDRARPLPEETLESLRRSFVIRYAYETTAIEGNTLDLHEARVVLEEGLTIGGKSLREHLELRNMKAAVEWVELAARGSEPLTEDTVRRLHGIVMQGILVGSAGCYRRHPVFIRGAWHVPPNWIKVPDLMAEFSGWLSRGPGAEHPVVFAAKAHVELARVHPFVDGNGRTARLLTSLLLMRRGYPPAMYAAARREEYFKALDKAHTAGDIGDFVEVTAVAVEHMEDQYLRAIREMREARREIEQRDNLER